LEKLVSTSSTKSDSAKKAGRKERSTPSSRREREVAAAPPRDVIPESVWHIGVIVIVMIAAVLRLYDLALVPLHHDEGVNGNFLVKLVREGSYQYDPENYHGPTLYYFSAVIPWITKVLFGTSARENYGLTTFTIRLIPALFSLATIALIFLLRRRLGTLATLAAALMLAISPGAVYLSRYFIHETLFVFFTLGIVVAAVRFYDERNPAYLLPAGACAALLFATKETAIISAVVLIIALGSTWAYMRFTGKSSSARQRRTGEKILDLTDEMGGPAMLLWGIGLAIFLFIALYVLFYTSFYTHTKGFWDSLQTFNVWSKTGRTAHVHSPSQYVFWLLWIESPLLILGAVGAVFAALKPKNSLALFCALWSFGLIAAYSLIPYKTPWLLLNFVVPLALIAGYAIQAIFETDHFRWRLVAVILAFAIGVASFQCLDLNFVNYDNDNEKYVYVYAHTTRGMLDLVNHIEQIAKKNSGGQTGITIVSPDYWPLPWYLRNFTRVGYFGRMAATSEPMIIANENQKAEVEASYGQVYEQVQSGQNGGSFELRPGVKLLLYERRR
jgi:uncharacterized protein (TIGR03663 family)